MKTNLNFLLGAILLATIIFPIIGNDNSLNDKNFHNADPYNESGLDFTLNHSEINTKYSDFASAVFRNKLIVVSSKKIGLIGNGKNEVTNEPFTDLFCLDYSFQGKVSYPLLFSRILNTKDNEGAVSFSLDQHTIYFTRSTRENPKNFQLYKADLERGSNGNWKNVVQLTKNSTYSVEHPFVSRDGKLLYFSSNRNGGFGGYDLYAAEIKNDGRLGEPLNLGNTVNTSKDETHPHFSENGRYMFFSSNGHNTLGGFDIFVSKKVFDEFKEPRNLGQTVNSSNDELAFVYLNDKKGVFSSNKSTSIGSFDIYEFDAQPIYKNLEGIVMNDKNVPITNTTIVLLDDEGNEVSRQITNDKAEYKFKVRAFEDYTIKAFKTGFAEVEFEVSTNENQRLAFSRNLIMTPSNEATVKK